MDKSISRAYIASQIKLRNEVFSNWQTFYNALCSGPNVMKKHLSDIWNSITEKDVTNGLPINDLDRHIDENDFKITQNSINGINVFFIIFPDPTTMQAQAKCVAIALTRNIPSYYTMEIGSHYLTNEPYYVFGEWKVNNGYYQHVNHGPLNHDTIECFASSVINLLNSKYTASENNQ